MSFVRNGILQGCRAAVIAVVCILGCLGSSNAFAQSAAKLEISTLSSRPDLVSGGDALVEVWVGGVGGGVVSLSQITLTLNGKDVTGQLNGLEALTRGAISVDEFLDLNEKMGGNKIDGNFTPQRSVGDPIAIRAAYESGLMNSGGGGLANVPILHSRSYNDAAGDIHDRHRDLTIRARLEKANGRFDNQVIWVGPARQPNQASGADLTSLSVDAMNKCQLKPINYGEYKATFTLAQKARMTAIFPSGVCDFSKPGVEQVPLKGTYRRY